MSSLRLDFVFPRFKILSGAERSILELARALADAGHKPRILCHRFHTSCEPLLDSRVQLVQTGIRLEWSRSHYLNAVLDYARVGRLRRLLDPAADAYVLVGPAASILALLRLRRSRVAIVVHSFEPPRALYRDHELVLQRLGPWRLLLKPLLVLYRAFDRWLVRQAGAVTCVGPYPAARIEEIYGRPAIAVTHGLDRARLDAAKGPDSTDASGRRGNATTDLITVNYLHPRKRVDLVIRALAELDAVESTDAASEPAPAGQLLVDLEASRTIRAPKVLEIVGAGPELQALEKLAVELGVEAHVRFAGFVPEAELAARYRAARCYVHAASEESLGLSIMEAAYCGLPVVAVDEGGVTANVIDGETGFLVRPEPAAIAAAVARVLSLPDAGASLGAAGSRHVDSMYQWSAGAQDMLRAVEEARQ